MRGSKGWSLVSNGRQEDEPKRRAFNGILKHTGSLSAVLATPGLGRGRGSATAW